VILLYACELIFTRAGTLAREIFSVVALASVLYVLATGSLTLAN
jgi:hypothetical protein